MRFRKPIGFLGKLPRSVRQRALIRATRTAVVTFIGFAIGRWVIHDVNIAVFATFTGIAITGIADFGGTIRGRVGAVLVAATIGTGLVALGTFVSTGSIVVSCVAMFLIVVGVAFAGLLGGYAAAGANAVTLFYVVAAGSPASTSAVLPRMEGVALGGTIALTASCILWSATTPEQVKENLGRLLAQFASQLDGLANSR